VNAKRVLIVGGGVAGLTAANRLREAGVEAIIIEGRSRLGGRIHTVDVDGTDTSWVDMGAAWIDDHRTNKVYEVLAAAGTGVEPIVPGLTNTRAYDERDARWLGRVRTVVTMAKLAWRVHRLKSTATGFANLGARIDRLLGRNPKRADEYLLKTMTELLNGGPVDEAHHNGFSADWEFLRYKEKTSVMVTGGYRHLVDALAEPLDDDMIFLDHEVARVRVDGGDGETPHVVVETTDGSTFEGSHVIVTVPIGVLKAGSISFEPRLPTAKQGAIERVGVGHVEKVALCFEHPFWRTKADRPLHFFSIPDPIAPHSTFIDVSETAGAGPGAAASPSLVAICATQTARRTAADPEQAVRDTLAALERMFPESYEPPLATATSDWSANPFSRGVYSYQTSETRRGDYMEIGQSIHGGRVLFAGDSCVDGTYLSSVEGALESGERAAAEVTSSSPGRATK
jgi:monoamine oxidase